MLDEKNSLGDEELDAVTGGAGFLSHDYTCAKCGKPYTRSQALDAIYIIRYGGCFCDACIKALKQAK